MIQDVNSTLAEVLIGHPKLTNDFHNPSLEEVGTRAKFFEFGNLSVNSAKYVPEIAPYLSQYTVVKTQAYSDEKWWNGSDEDDAVALVSK